jgi:ABC-type lipoprotein export system ATPase subunit
LQNPLETAAPLLSFDHASKHYTNAGEPVRALDDVSLEVGSGQFVAVMGRSGCGKSTLLHLAGALDFPTTGHVRLDGVATDQLTEAGLTRLRREKIGFVFQSFQLLNTLSVVENVEVPLLLASEGNARFRAMERLADVGLAELAHRMTHQLSGGQMQRVAIARALVHSPRLILADADGQSGHSNRQRDSRAFAACVRRTASHHLDGHAQCRGICVGRYDRAHARRADRRRAGLKWVTWLSSIGSYYGLCSASLDVLS